MFTQITWSSYITIVLISLICYYLVIGYLFYRHDLLRLLSGIQNNPGAGVSFTAPQELSEKGNGFEMAQAASDEIRAFLLEGATNQIPEPELINGLHLLLTKYPALKNSAFSTPIENLVIRECQMNFSMHLQAGEVKALWG